MIIKITSLIFIIFNLIAYFQEQFIRLKNNIYLINKRGKVPQLLKA